MDSQFQEIRNTQTPEKSARWYQDAIRKVGLSNARPSSVMNSDIGTFETRPEPGNMYLFFYDPKTKDKLPYYDTVPLVMVFDINPNGFHGINFHYLPPMMRMQLLGKMLDYTSTKEIDEKTQFTLRWNTLKNASRFPGVRPSVKQYLSSNIKSRLLKINPTDWKISIMLPISNFEKKSRLTVFRDSRRNI